MIKNIRSKYSDAPIVFINMPPIKEFPIFTKSMKFVLGNLVEIFGEELQKIVQKRNNVFFCSEKITVNSWVKTLKLKGERNDFFSDGVHPSKQTYQVWGKEIANYILRNKEILKTIS